MIINISKKHSARACDIIGIFDADTSTRSAHTKAFLVAAQNRGATADDGGLPNAFVLISPEGKKNAERVIFTASSAGHICASITAL